MGLVKEFKEFISKGSMVDMAIGVIIGTAVKAVVDSLVADIIMPVVGLFTGNINFANLKYVLKPASIAADGTEIAENAIRYGALIEQIISFLIIALVVFFIIKAVNDMRARAEKKKEVVEEVAAPTTDELLAAILAELRKD